MSRRGRITVFVSIGLLLVAIAAIEVASGLSQEEPAAAEVVLPSSVLVAPRATVASLRGKPSIVHFWASWCDPCIKEAREFPKLAEQLGGRANLVGVDFSDDHAGARAFVRRFGWTFPVLVDAAGTAGERDGETHDETPAHADGHAHPRSRAAGRSHGARRLPRAVV